MKDPNKNASKSSPCNFIKQGKHGEKKKQYSIS